MIPNARGWWWRRHDGPPAHDIVANVLTVRGRMMWCAGSRLGGDVTDDGAWLGPVAPPGSVAPDVVARLVRDAWEAGRSHQERVDAAIHAYVRSGIPGSVGSYAFDDERNETRAALHAALTAAGADADAVIAGVER